MKTIYEKAEKFCGYLKDIVYMMRFYQDHYVRLNNYKNTYNNTMILRNANEKMRSYYFNFMHEEFGIMNAITTNDMYDRLITITNSKSHIDNNIKGDRPKYNFVMYYYDKVEDDMWPLFDMLTNGIESDTIKETEFQALMLHNEDTLQKYYIAIIMMETLGLFSDLDMPVPILALGSTDILRFIPARKAMIDMMTKKVGDDWKTKLEKRYGHVIK
ncbi:hypothetical protein SEPL_350 [Salmonella phage SE_PL]|nr:hypothetical protein [Salmonella enterica]ELL7856462.1 hypothetical protein [Salmonella enterica]QCW18748.1 hypothetical protein 7t3_0227 [Salmonella phage 7t3]QIG62963.1 hypothetical protein SEPL_350 [Salmonella phage SE_PL]